MTRAAICFIILFNMISVSLMGQNEKEKAWVDTELEKLSLEGKIAQLMMVRAYSNKGKDHVKYIETLIKKHKIGGLTFFQGGPVRQANLINHYQEISKLPLFISQDAEWGLGMRLDSTFSFPYQMTLGAMQDDSLIYKMGERVAAHLRAVGVHMNLAPVVDINNNPANPVINVRSFGEDKYNVSKKGIAYMKGLQNNGIISTAKHFPGHGDTDADSHFTLPLIQHKKLRLDTLELYPFKELINNGLDGVMIAHLYVKSIDDTENLASTLSEPLVTGVLKNELEFKGLIVTDALDMHGVTKYHPSGEIEIKALQAGNDLLILPQDIPKAIKKIKRAVKNDELSEALIDERCRKVLSYKYRAGLSDIKQIDTENLFEKLNDPESYKIEWEIYKKAITLVKNDQDFLPLKGVDSLNIASIAFGGEQNNDFQKMISNFTWVKQFKAGKSPSTGELNDLKESLEDYDVLIISIHNTSDYKSKNWGLGDELVSFIEDVSLEKRVVLDIFAIPYAISRFGDLDNVESLIISYQDTEVSQKVSAQMIFGSLSFGGRLPVSANDEFMVNTGIDTRVNGKLVYTIPEILDADLDKIKAIDELISSSINDGVFPGCQIMAAKDGKVFYQRSFGYHTYDKKRQVENTDLYDLASLTKIFGSVLAVMKLNDKNKINIDQRISKYLPYTIGTNKETVIIREMMAHQARLTAWIKFYDMIQKNEKLDSNICSSKVSERFPYRVAENIYINKNYPNIMYDSILESKLRESSKYLYSDVGFYFVYKIVESITNKPFDVYLNEAFYKPMGCYTICYHPRYYYPLAEIVPTEKDTYFRRQLIHGDVHDPGAAMLGGICGHAGLFSNANDLAILMQMLIQGGDYAGSNYIDSATIEEFTTVQFPLNDNRRGIGFDKPLLKYHKNGPACKSASPESYGHSGFTGTYAWADPENGLIYIFLSNRVYPDADNWKISKRDIRTRVHEMFYQAVKE